MITGEVCFSTQKVRYAPVINGKNIFTDAYITKRYTITYDKITGRMSYSINNASYKSDNVTEAIEHYNECKGCWTDLTGQTTAEIFQRAKTMENKQNVKQNKPRL